MHVIKCPACGKTLRLSQPVQQKKVRCSGCNSVFVGSTQVVAENAALAASSPSLQTVIAQRSARPVRRAVKQPTPKWMIAAAGAAAVGALVGIIWLAYLSETENVTYTDDAGRQITRRMSKDEAEKLRQDIKARDETARKAAVAATPAPAPAVERPVAPAAPATRAPSAPSVAADVPARPADLTPEQAIRQSTVMTGSDSQLGVLLDKAVYGLDVTQGHVIGTLTNNSLQALDTVSIEAHFTDSSGRNKTLSAQLRYVPSGGVMGFSMPYKSMDAAAIVAVTTKVTASRLDKDNVTVLDVDDTYVSIERKSTTVEVRGRVDNPGRQSLPNVKVVCDFYTDDGLHAGSVETTLDNQRGLEGMGTGYFRATMNMAGTGVLPQLVKSVTVRAVASR